MAGALPGSRKTASAAGALDNSYAEVRDALERLDSDLEMIRFTVDEADQTTAVARLVEHRSPNSESRLTALTYRCPRRSVGAAVGGAWLW